MYTIKLIIARLRVDFHHWLHYHGSDFSWGSNGIWIESITCKACKKVFFKEG